MTAMMFLSATAGIFGIGMGGILGLFFADCSNKVLSCMLAFAAGIMVSIVSFELLPEAMQLADILHASVGMLSGMGVMILLTWVVDRVKEQESKIQIKNKTADHKSKNQEALYRSGIIMLLAISLHNFPEGIAIGSGGAHNPALGTGIAFVIALHNIPEGMAISAPLVAGGMRRQYVVFLTALSGVSTLLGAAVGFGLGGISDTVTSFSIAAAGGAMMYVVFSEIFPESLEILKDRSPAIVALIGYVVGMLFVGI